MVIFTNNEESSIISNYCFANRFQCVVTVIGCYFIHSLSVAYPDRINFPKPEISYRKLAKVRRINSLK